MVSVLDCVMAFAVAVKPDVGNVSGETPLFDGFRPCLLLWFPSSLEMYLWFPSFARTKDVAKGLTHCDELGGKLLQVMGWSRDSETLQDCRVMWQTL